MKNIKNYWYKIYSSVYFPFFVLGVSLLMFNLSLHLGWGDDEWFLNALKDTTKWSYIVSRYKTWTSRLIIEYFLINLVRFPILWKLLNASITILGAVSISKLFSLKPSRSLNWIICAITLLVPVKIYWDTGWIATTLNYSWPLFLGLFSMIPIKKVLNNEKIAFYEYIFYVLAMVYAANQEQMCAILLGTYLVFFIYLYLEHKKISAFFLSAILLNLFSLVFELLTPGNKARRATSVEWYFPDFDKMSFLKKLELGFSSTLFDFIMKPNTVFFLFTLLLCICVFIKRKNVIIRMISLIPCTLCGFFGMFSTLFEPSFPVISFVKNSMTQYGTQINFSHPKSFIPDIILVLVCFAVIISLVASFDDKKVSLLPIFVILLGFGSRMIMAFSPTIWASSIRTFLFMYFSFIICSVILYQVIKNSAKTHTKQLVDYSIFVLFIISFLNALI